LALDARAQQCDAHGRAAVVRNGHLPEREVLIGIGPVAVRVPKARSRTDEPVVFRSRLVPPYVRKAKSVEAALPWLYLRGISTGQMQQALSVSGASGGWMRIAGCICGWTGSTAVCGPRISGCVHWANLDETRRAGQNGPSCRRPIHAADRLGCYERLGAATCPPYQAT
jgi:hypothetical protein